MTDRGRELRDRLATHGRSLFDRGYRRGSSGSVLILLDRPHRPLTTGQQWQLPEP